MYATLYGRFRSLSRILLITGAFAGMTLAATSSQAQNYPPPQAPPGSARLAHLQGNVSVQPDGVQDWGQATQNMPIGSGDRVYTDQQGEGELQADQVRAYFSPNSDLTLTNLNDQGVELGLASGSVNFFSDGFPPNQSLFVSTPNGGITLRTRGNFRVDVYPDQQSTVVTVQPNGADVELNGAGDFHMILRRGESIQLSGTNPVYTQPLEIGGYDEFAHWSGAIETHRYNSISARYVSAEMPGYEELDNAGDWQPESDYGPIWYPHVDRDWAPYHNGHWVNRPYYGWTWVADESWGAAPFHYGRWVRVRDRWGWIPGPREVHPVWSPAQVVFAGGIHVGGVGVSVWFPLGPGEAYHPWYNASPEYVNRINQTNIRESKVVHIQNTYVTNTVVNNTTINNITYVNRTAATAVRQEDFAAGHNARAVAVKVDPVQLQHAQPARPEVKPPAQPVILHPVAKPVAVPVARPVLINHQGQAAPAAPNAKPVVVPVKAAPPVAPKPVPGHAPIGTPSVGGRPVTTVGKPPVAANPPATPNPPAPNPAAPNKPLPPARVEPAKPIQPAPTPTPVNPPRPNAPPNRLPAPAPAPTPANPQRPVPENRQPPPAPTPAPVAPVRPTPPPARITPTPAPTPVTPARPATPPARTTQPPPTTPVRPQPAAPETRPVPPQPRPAAPETRPALPQPRPAPPETRPVPPQPRPAAPETRPAQPQPKPPAPETRPARPTAPQPPPPAKNAPKKDEKKQDQKNPPKKPE
jgi:hypothetical protein